MFLLMPRERQPEFVEDGVGSSENEFSSERGGSCVEQIGRQGSVLVRKEHVREKAVVYPPLVGPEGDSMRTPSEQMEGGFITHLASCGEGGHVWGDNYRVPGRAVRYDWKV